MDGHIGAMNESDRAALERIKPLRKLKSPHWQHFTIKTLEDGSLRAFCKYCNKSLTCGPKAGTSHIARHARNCRKLLSPSANENPNEAPRSFKNREKLQWKRKNQKPLPLIQTFCAGNTNINNFVLDQSLCRLELTKMLIIHELPFKIVEHEAFRRFVKTLNPEFTTIQRDAIITDSTTIYEMGKLELKEVLRSCDRISISVNLWVSDQDLSYACLTAHYIDDCWRTRRRILSSSLIRTPHDGISMSGIISKSLAQWEIDGKIFSMTCDDSPLNDSVKTLILQKSSLLYHVRCCSHVLGEIIAYGLQVLNQTISTIRESVKYVKSASSREEVFDQVVSQLGLLKKKSLIIDVASRWDSTYHMLDSAVYYKRAFLVLGQWDDDYNLAPTSEDWKKAEFFSKFLKICCNAVNVLTATRSPTSNMCLHEICAVHNFLRQEVDFSESTVNDMIRVMQSKFDQYWGESTLLYAISTVLDPRFKMLFLKYAFEQIYGGDFLSYVDEVSRTLYSVFYQFKEESSEREASKRNQADGEGGEEEDMNEETEVFVGYNQFLSQQSLKEAKSDLDRYLGESVVPLNQKSFDVLKWWSDNSLVYPVLSKMARAYLAIPGSMVGSEEAFSLSGIRIDRLCSTLPPDVGEALVCLRDWLREEYVEGEH